MNHVLVRMLFDMLRHARALGIGDNVSAPAPLPAESSSETADLFAVAEMRRAYGRPPVKPRPAAPAGIFDLGPEVSAQLLPAAPPPYAIARLYHRGRIAMAAVLMRPRRDDT